MLALYLLLLTLLPAPQPACLPDNSLCAGGFNNAAPLEWLTEQSQGAPKVADYIATTPMQKMGDDAVKTIVRPQTLEATVTVVTTWAIGEIVTLAKANSAGSTIDAGAKIEAGALKPFGGGGNSTLNLADDVAGANANGNNIVFRVIRADENPINGLFAKNPS